MERAWAAAVNTKMGSQADPGNLWPRPLGKDDQGLKEVPWAGEEELGRRQPLFWADLTALATWGQVC